MELFVKQYGEGTPLLMIHGIMSDHNFFAESAGILSKTYHVISYDRRGYGKSTGRQYTDFSVSTQAQDAAEILRATAAESAWIFGNSAGGLIAIELAQQYPELVRGMVLLEPSLAYDAESVRRLDEWNKELNRYRDEKKTKRALPAFARVISCYENKRKVVDSSDVSMEEMKKQYLNLQNFMYGELNEVQRYRPGIVALRRIAAPVMVGVTRLGKDSIFATSSRSGAEVLGWGIAEFPGYHNVAQDMPNEFADVLRDILEEMEKK